MAWPNWMIRATLKKVLRPVAAELQGEPMQGAPATPFLGLLSSCGLHLATDIPFDLGKVGDPSFRHFDRHVDPEQLKISHGHYDESGVRSDWQLAFPVDVVDEEIAAGRLRGLHSTLHSFRGFFYDSRAFVDHHLPRVVTDLQEGGVDAVLLTPC